MSRLGRYQTSREIAAWIASRVGYGTTQKMLAKELGVSSGYLSDVLAGNRECGPRILNALGYDPTPHYRMKDKP